MIVLSVSINVFQHLGEGTPTKDYSEMTCVTELSVGKKNISSNIIQSLPW